MPQTTFSSRMCSDRVWLLFCLLVLLAITKDDVGAQELSKYITLVLSYLQVFQLRN